MINWKQKVVHRKFSFDCVMVFVMIFDEITSFKHDEVCADFQLRCNKYFLENEKNAILMPVGNIGEEKRAKA